MELHIPEPHPRQRLFLADRHKYIAFGGARGGGKSWSVRVKAILLALRYPGIKIMIVRRTFPELMANHLEPLSSMLAGVAKLNKTEKIFYFPNRSTIRLGSAQNEQELNKFQGTEVDVLFIDEATQFTEMEFMKFKACVRGVNGFPKRVYLTCNPGGVGHDWVKRLFIDKNYNPSEHAEEYSFIKSLVTDNLALMRDNPDYIAQLEALPPKLRQAWLEGDWDIFEGQFFEEFRTTPSVIDCNEAGITPEEALRQRRFTHVIEPFEIPREWRIYKSFDFGYAKPFSCDWWAVDYDGRAYLILQLYGCTGEPNEGVKWHPDKMFSEIARLEKEHRWLRGKTITGVADPSIWDRSRGEAISDFADAHRVFFSPADNTRLPGWMQCHYRLAFDDEGYPMMYFFNTCQHAIRTLPSLCYSETNVEDLDTDQEDHFADSMRYFCMSRPIAPRMSVRQSAKPISPLDL